MRWSFIFMWVLLAGSSISSSISSSLLAEEIRMPEKGICAHRGAKSLFPENTIPAFEEAVRRNAEMIELDICYTKDKKIVILHDRTIDRTSNGKGKISDWLFDDVRKLDFGSWKDPKFAGTQIPTLEEALAVIPRNIWINVHLKGSVELGLEAAETIVRLDRAHQAFLAAGRKVQDAVREKFPQVMFCNMERQGTPSDYVALTLELKTEFIQVTAMPTPEEVKALHDAGIRINYFGTNDPEMYRKLHDAGVQFPLVDDLPRVGR